MKDSKSVLHIVSVFFSVPIFFGDQFKHFYKKGFDMHVICSPNSEIKFHSFEHKYKYKEIPIKRSISICQDLVSLIKIVKYIKTNKIDTVVGHTPKGALLAMIGARIAQVPERVYFRHGLLYETSTGFKRWLLISLERLTAFCSTKIVCVSPSLFEKSLVDKLNQRYKQLVLGRGTCGGIDAISKFNPENILQDKLNNYRKIYNISKDNFVIGFCGRIVKDKGIVDLVLAFKNIEKKYNVKLLLVGGFEDRDVLPKGIINEIISNENIIMTGFVYDDIEYFYSLMSLFVLPSYREGFGLSVLEASAMQIPVLTTAVTGCIDSIINTKTGFYISNTVESIEENIVRMINYENLKSIGVQGREFVVEHFDNKILWEIIEKQLYRRT